MWQVDNNTPLAIERGFLRDGDGVENWVVVIKGAFDVHSDGRLRRAKEQIPPARTAQWSGEPGRSNFLQDTDFVLTKRGTDVLVRGHAYAPKNRPARAIDLGLKIGKQTKQIRAFGARAWMQSTVSSAIVPGPAVPFERLRLSYEHAFGGVDPDAPKGRPAASAFNPLGTGFRYEPESLIGSAAPRFEHPDESLRAGAHDAEPPGFGPLAPGWVPRVRYAGTYDEQWKSNRAPLLPADFDDRFNQSAPLDQQSPTFLRPGDQIALLNGSPSGFLGFRVPELKFGMRVIFSDGEEAAPAALHTVLVDGDSSRVQLTWHCRLPCHAREHRLLRAVINWEGDRACLSP